MIKSDTHLVAPHPELPACIPKEAVSILNVALDLKVLQPTRAPSVIVIAATISTTHTTSVPTRTAL